MVSTLSKILLSLEKESCSRCLFENNFSAIFQNFAESEFSLPKHIKCATHILNLVANVDGNKALKRRLLYKKFAGLLLEKHKNYGMCSPGAHRQPMLLKLCFPHP